MDSQLTPIRQTANARRVGELCLAGATEEERTARARA